MSDKGTAFQKGGGGTNFEQYIQASFLATLLIRGNAPCIPTNEITEIVLQATNRNWETDDMLIIAKSQKATHQLLAQIKHNIIFSEDNKIFEEVIRAFWKDFNDPRFSKTNDRLLILKNRLTNAEKNHIKTIINYAKTHASEKDFLMEVERIKEKKARLDIFRCVLKKANGEVEITDLQLWQFLNCMDLLGYDFLNDGSIDETYILNLLKLSKSSASTASEKDIWNGLLGFISKNNPTGGNFTIESLKTEEFFSYFNTQHLVPAFKDVEKLRTDSEAILKPIRNQIGTNQFSFHLERANPINQISEAIGQAKITIVKGKAGAGKSAAVKEVLTKSFPHASKFVFRADQFNQPHLSNVFSAVGIHSNIKDIFSCVSLTPDKIIFIDSFEKLLEGVDPNNAFRQLISILHETDIKVIGTSRSYAIELLVQKFDIDTDSIKLVEIPLLSDEELEIVNEKFPSVSGPLQNLKIKSLLRSPKYLDFTIQSLALSTDDFSKYSVSEFKGKLWNTLVNNAAVRTNGLPAKRERAFMEIAVERARAMKLFVKPTNSDDEAIDLLENDDLIFQDENKRKYAPSHDILEDWALVKYVAACYDDHPDVLDFFKSLGNEPAIRRAFRLWVEDFVIDQPAKINSLITATLSKPTLGQYWADELLTAVFKSENNSFFFNSFETELLADNAVLFSRCIHLIKTACRETNYGVHESPILLPVGSGWQELLAFVKKNIKNLNELRQSILEFLALWQYRLIFQFQRGEPQYEDAKEIVLCYIGQIENGDEFWQQRSIENYHKVLVSILFFFPQLAKAEITTLVSNAFEKDDEPHDWRLHSFYEVVIDRLLSGVGTQRLALVLPDLMLNAAWRHWKYVPPQPTERDSLIEKLIASSISNEQCWGIADKFGFTPAGIYKTPIYNILSFHPRKGVEFIIQFINYCVEYYVNNECDYKHEVYEVSISLNDGTVIKQYGGQELWFAYRGLSVTHYLLESLLMSLEKYLLDLAGEKNESSRKRLKFLFDQLLHNSNSVMVTAVLVSAAMAYPTEVEEEMLPLVSIKEMYRWESARALREPSALAPYDQHIPFAQRVRWELNQLPHRTKWRRGFADFLVDYQLTIGTVNAQLMIILDKLWSEATNDDIVWRKKLHEIDTRKWEAKEFEGKTGQFVLQPKYEISVAKFMETGKEKMEKTEKTSRYSVKLQKVLEEKEIMQWQEWEEQYKYFSSLEDIDVLHDKPVSCAVVGLRFFKEELSPEQTEWCIGALFTTISYIIGGERRLDMPLPLYNIMEKETALNSFHLLFDATDDPEDIKELTFTLAYALMAPFAEYEMERFTAYMRTSFAKAYPEITHKIWWILVKCSQFKIENQYFYDDPDTDRLNAAREKEFKFIEDLCKNQDIQPLKMTDFTFENAKAYIWCTAFFILPYSDMLSDYRDFTFRFIDLIGEDLQKKQEYDFPKRKKGRQLHHRLQQDCENCFAELLLQADTDFSKTIINKLTEKAYSIIETTVHIKGDIIGFTNDVLDNAIDKVDMYITSERDEVNKGEAIAKFWELWKHVYGLVAKSKKEHFTSVLLFDKQYSWSEERQDFEVLRGKTKLYQEMLYTIGSKTIKSAVRVLSTIGTKEFLPEGLSWITDLLKANPEQIADMNTISCERMIKRLYFDHMATIKSNQTLINDFIWLLDNLIQLGNSNAFLYRENVITYKKDN